MISKDVQKYATDNWSDYRQTVSVCSYDSRLSRALVKNETIVYCFDSIVETLFQKTKKPTSVDSIHFQGKEVWFIEFKSGFIFKTTKENYKDPFPASCEEAINALNLCKDYFFRIRKLEKNELRDNLKLKAVESYMALEKCILDACSEITPPRKLVLYIVVDIDNNDAEEDILGSLVSEKKRKNGVKESLLDNLRQSLTRYVCVKDLLGKDYFYDEVRVCSAVEFSKVLSNS